MYQDKTLKCKDCGAEFVFTASEQEYYAEKGFQRREKESGSRTEGVLHHRMCKLR